MEACQQKTEKIDYIIAQPFKCGDISRVGGVSVVRPLSVSEPRSLDQPVSRNIVLGILDLGVSRVSFEDLEGRKYDSAG